MHCQITWTELGRIIPFNAYGLLGSANNASISAEYFQQNNSVFFIKKSILECVSLVHIKDKNNPRKQCIRHSTKEIEFLITLAVLREYQMLQVMQRILQESFCMFHKQSMLGFLAKALMWQRTKTCELWTKIAKSFRHLFYRLLTFDFHIIEHQLPIRGTLWADKENQYQCY